MTQPAEAPVEYPSSWKTPDIRRREAEERRREDALEVEVYLSSLSDREFAELTRRARGGR